MADKTEELFNPNDRLGTRDGGPYADQVELVQAEKRRAAVEGREPDYDNLSPTAGVPAVTKAVLDGLKGGGVQPTHLEDPKPIAEAPAYVEPDQHPNAKGPKTDEQKIEAAQAKAVDKNEAPTDALDVSKAVAE